MLLLLLLLLGPVYLCDSGFCSNMYLLLAATVSVCRSLLDSEHKISVGSTIPCNVAEAKRRNR
jgi:hypothetical protein